MLNGKKKYIFIFRTTEWLVFCNTISSIFFLIFFFVVQYKALSLSLSLSLFLQHVIKTSYHCFVISEEQGWVCSYVWQGCEGAAVPVVLSYCKVRKPCVCVCVCVCVSLGLVLVTCKISRCSNNAAWKGLQAENLHPFSLRLFLFLPTFCYYHYYYHYCYYYYYYYCNSSSLVVG